MTTQNNNKDFFSINLNSMLVESSSNEYFAENEQFAVGIKGSLRYENSLLTAASLLSLLTEQPDLKQHYQTFSGAFYLVAVDKSANTVTLVNDHLGMQPCYYSCDNHLLLISSSLNKIKRASSQKFKLSKQAIYNYIYFHCIPAPTTIYEQASKIEPSKAIIWQNNTKQTDLFYQPEFASKNEDVGALNRECLDVIESSVAQNVATSCGAFLSGGLDSSTVAGMLAKTSDLAKTFSIGFNIEGYDETPYAELTAKHFNTEHKVLYLQPEQAVEKFVEVAQYFEEPFGNSSAMATYFCAKFAKENGIEVLLAGDGGDELFAGNERYAKQKTFELYQNLPSPVQGLLKAGFCHQPFTKVPVLSKAKSYVEQASVKLPERLQTYNFINQLGLNAIFTPEFLTGVDTELPVRQLQSRYHDCTSADPVDKMLYLDWKFTLADNDLFKVSKMCELAGIEVRYPLLEKSVVDFSCKVTAENKLPGKKLRHFYKESCRGFLADGTLTKSKHGFGLPFGAWMKENPALKELTLNALSAFKQRNIVSQSLVEQALQAHQSVHSGYFGELIWIMVVLELWLQKEESDH